MMSNQDASHRGHVRFQKMAFLFLKTILRKGLNKLTCKNRPGSAEYSPDNKSDATFKTSSNSILLPSFSALPLADNIAHRIIGLLLLGNPAKAPTTCAAVRNFLIKENSEQAAMPIPLLRPLTGTVRQQARRGYASVLEQPPQKPAQELPLRLQAIKLYKEVSPIMTLWAVQFILKLMCPTVAAPTWT